MKISRLWKRDNGAARPLDHPDIEAQADKIVKASMADLGKALRRSAQIRQHLADGALELRGTKR